MTPEEEWAVLNTAGFDQAMFGKINGIRTAMESAEVKSTDGLETNVQGVYVYFKEEGNYLIVTVGKDAQGNPQASMKIPSVWLEG